MQYLAMRAQHGAGSPLLAGGGFFSDLASGFKRKLSGLVSMGKTAILAAAPILQQQAANTAQSALNAALSSGKEMLLTGNQFNRAGLRNVASSALEAARGSVDRGALAQQLLGAVRPSF